MTKLEGGIFKSGGEYYRIMEHRPRSHKWKLMRHEPSLNSAWVVVRDGMPYAEASRIYKLMKEE